MLKNFFKTTLRNLLKKKTNSFLNIFGLAIGITRAGFFPFTFRVPKNN